MCGFHGMSERAASRNGLAMKQSRKTASAMTAPNRRSGPRIIMSRLPPERREPHVHPRCTSGIHSPRRGCRCLLRDAPRPEQYGSDGEMQLVNQSRTDGYEATITLSLERQLEFPSENQRRGHPPFVSAAQRSEQKGGAHASRRRPYPFQHYSASGGLVRLASSNR